jgi:heat shock protein HslJ
MLDQLFGLAPQAAFGSIATEQARKERNQNRQRADCHERGDGHRQLLQGELGASDCASRRDEQGHVSEAEHRREHTHAKSAKNSCVLDEAQPAPQSGRFIRPRPIAQRIPGGEKEHHPEPNPDHDGQLMAKFDCNQGDGSYTASAGRLALMDMRSTLMLCEPNSQEVNFQVILQSATWSRRWRADPAPTLLARASVES